jgi:hypothetical protein
VHVVIGLKHAKRFTECNIGDCVDDEVLYDPAEIDRPQYVSERRVFPFDETEKILQAVDDAFF